MSGGGGGVSIIAAWAAVRNFVRGPQSTPERAALDAEELREVEYDAMGMEAPRPAPTASRTMSTVRAAAAPLIVAALAFLLWWISDRLVVIGPVDRATFGWLVVIPVWAAAPFVAGLRWRQLAAAARWRAAALVATVIGGLIAVLLWSSTVGIACDFGATRTALGLIPPSLGVGAIVGGFFGAACLSASRFIANGRPWLAALLSAAFQVGVIPVAGSAFFFLFYGLCNRP